MNEEIQYGQPLSGLAAEKAFNILLLCLEWEETGELSEMVNKLADFYEMKLKHLLKG